MDCTTFQAILSGQVEDDLGPAESQALEAHLRACDPCRDALAHAEDELAPLVERMEPPEVPAAAWDRVTRAVRAEAARPVLVVHPGGAAPARFPRGLMIAAAFLIAAGIGALLPLDMFKGVGGADALSRMPGPVKIDPPPPAPSPGSPASTSPAIVAGTRAEVRRLEFDPRRFDAMAMVYDCGDEDVVLITVRDL